MLGDRKVVIVTGGASGIGLATVRSFAEQGAHVGVLDVSQQSDDLVKALASEYPQARFAYHKANITDWDALAQIFEQIYTEQGHIDIVYANAGISREESFAVAEEKPSKPGLGMLEINLIGTIYTVKLATHYMMKNKVLNGPRAATRGSILITASIAALYPFPIAPIYAATKAGVVGLVRSLAEPLQKVAIQINAVAPAFIRTNLAGENATSAVFDSVVLTPMSTLTRGVQQLVSDPSLTGQVAVAHGDSVTMDFPPAFVDEDTEKNINTLWKLGLISAKS